MDKLPETVRIIPPLNWELCLTGLNWKRLGVEGKTRDYRATKWLVVMGFEVAISNDNDGNEDRDRHANGKGHKEVEGKNLVKSYFRR